MKPSSKWIQTAILHEGALKEYAKKQNAITGRGTIDIRWLQMMAQRNDAVGHRARLAINLHNMRNK